MADVTQTTPTDDALCELLAAREHSPAATSQAHWACGVLYDRHARGVLAFLASRSSRTEADDLHQAVWQRVWQSAGTGFRGGNFRAWLFQIARNLLIDERRKKRPQSLPEAHDDADHGASRPDDILLDRERMQTLAECLEKLESTAGALIRSRLRGESYEGICEQLKLTAHRAHRLLHTAKQQLQTCVNRSEA